MRDECYACYNMTRNIYGGCRAFKDPNDPIMENNKCVGFAGTKEEYDRIQIDIDNYSHIYNHKHL